LLRNWYFWLISALTGFAFVIRSYPAWTNAAWGADFGIYYGITKTFVETGQITYCGWGGSYQYFPVLYVTTAGAHFATGIDLIVLMPKLIPIFGALSVLIFYYVVKEITKNKNIAIVSSIFLSVVAFHTYQTSHSSPLTMAHFFMMLSFLFFLRFRNNSKYAIPLIISTILLIMTHHLTTYFYLISLVLIVFFENSSIENTSKKVWTFSVKKDIIYILFTAITVFSYWAFIATPVFNRFMTGGFKLLGYKVPSIITIFLFFVLFFLSFIIALYIRKFNAHIRTKFMETKSLIYRVLFRANPFVRRKLPKPKSRFKRIIIAMCIFYGIVIFFNVYPLPHLNFTLNYQVAILAFPYILLVSIGIIGFRFSCNIENGFFVRGWLFAIILSFLFSAITRSTALILHRHIEYIEYPFAIMIALGIGGLFGDFDFNIISEKIKKVFSKEKTFINRIKKIDKKSKIVISTILVLMVSNAVCVYPLHLSLNQSVENISQENVSVIIDWMDENLNKNISVIASDHRLERLAESIGFNTTKDETRILWSAENISDYIDELRGVGMNYSKITHVVLDSYMAFNVVHLGYGIPGVYMTNETWDAGYEKFNRSGNPNFDYEPIFTKIYRNESKSIDPITNQSIKWSEVYEVNWTYLDEKYPS